ncbi:MAG: hypothetical protein Q8R47_05495 [Nanoarchaeota archaeon]|nr:hypothetical protein [Nanoarchaeota archaeon]
MRFDQLELPDIEFILLSYEREVWPCPFIRQISPATILRDLQESNSEWSQWKEGYRLGSRWSIDSKLYFNVEENKARAHFFPNLPYPLEEEEKLFPETKKAGERFTRRVDYYLASRDKFKIN